MFKKDRALWWLEKGFKLLPCQPDKKSLVGGFGIYQAKITDEKGINLWWSGNAAANIAVIAPDEIYIIDFDVCDLYETWKQNNSGPAQSYTEITPRGGAHVFLRGRVPAGVELVNGVELKKAVLVCPSVVDSKPYKILDDRAEFLDIDPVESLATISSPGHASPYFLQASRARRVLPGNPLSRIEQIKQHFTISHVLKLYRPDIKLIGRGEFLTCSCPFHKDSKPSFFLNDSKGLWGCHGCKVGGDVINLYARFEAVNVREAISRMWAVMA